MAVEARLGLKLLLQRLPFQKNLRLNGCGGPVGLET